MISDLHLGGRPPGDAARPGFQLCRAYAELRDFVHWIVDDTRAARAGGEDVELVLNGDVIDFLAVDDYPSASTEAWTASDTAAVEKLEQAIARTRVDGEGFFDALARLLAEGLRLTLLLGNHDLELGLPAVRARLEDLLHAHPGRLRFVIDGEAYVAGRCLIEHGNRYDAWNEVDHDALREERSVRSRHLPEAAPRFVPPPGSELVIQVMNPLKQRFAFVDLLKPEEDAVIPLLLALAPDGLDLSLGLDQLVRTGRFVRRMQQQGQAAPARPRRGQSLGGLDDVADVAADSLAQVLERVLGDDAALFPIARAPVGGRHLGGDDEAPGARLVAWAEALRERVGGTLAKLDLWMDPHEDSRRRKLRAALGLLAGSDRSFSLTHEAPAYLDAARALIGTGGFDVVVFGHTHLPRHIEGLAGDGRGVYLNTGTWSDVMRLPEALAAREGGAADAAFDDFVDALRRGDFERYRRRYLSFAELVVEDDGRVAAHELHSFCGRARPRQPPLTHAGAEAAA